MDLQNLDDLRSVEELANYQKDVRGRVRELEDEFKGVPLDDEARAEYAALKSADESIDSRVKELSARAEYIRSLDAGEDPAGRRSVDDSFFKSRDRQAETRNLDIFDLSTIRASAWGDPDRYSDELYDRARRAVDIARFPGRDTDQMRSRVHDALETVTGEGDEERSGRNDLARHILITGSPIYNRAFGKTFVGQMLGSGAYLSSEEQRAMMGIRALSLGTSGIPIPYTLDPTVLGTSNLSVNPFRGISSVKQITVDEWRGATSGGVVAAFAAEATEASDNTPTMTQPTVSTEKAFAFVPASIEAAMDWAGLEAEMGREFGDAKDDLEATKFVSGSGTNEPFGIVTGSTNTVNATTGQAFDAEDLYRLEPALPPRYRPRASIVGNRSIYNLTRQFDTGGGANLWIRIGQGLRNELTGALGEALLGYPTYEASAMAAVTTTGTKFLLIGDVGRYVIVDRIGLTIEVIPHLFGAANRFPTGQRGLYAYWRVGAKLIDANATRMLIGIA